MELSLCKKTLRNSMEEEILLLNEFCREEEKIKDYIVKKNWEGLNRTIRNANPLIEQINTIEKKRNTAFVELRNHFGFNGEAGFYHVIVNFAEGERDIFADLYRNLKLSAIRIQSVTGGIDSYVSNVSGSMNSILDELFPARRGKIYSKQGNPTELEINPMVLNHNL